MPTNGVKISTTITKSIENTEAKALPVVENIIY